jgi:peptidoglycan/xylan/chitin deacetylase (PgdA/CDA1 family)
MHSGALALAQRLRGRQALILRYHAVQDDPAAHEHSIGTAITHATAAFREQVAWLARHYEPVTLDDLVAFLRGQRPMPRRCAAITFDDGFADNAETAAPILDRAGIKAAFYLTVDNLAPQHPLWFSRLRHAFSTTARETWRDASRQRIWRLTDPHERRLAQHSVSERCARTTGQAQDDLLARLERELGVATLAPAKALMMDWEQARALHRQGHIVGAHTLTHPNLAHVSAEEMAWEMGESKRRLEAELGAPVVHFSYPSPILEPHWDERTVACSRDLGFETAVTCRKGAVSAGASLLCLPRVYAPPETAAFRWAVDAAFAGWHV